MLLEEFEKKTNIFVPGEYFDLIHQFYMNTEMDKDQFCKGAGLCPNVRKSFGASFLISHQILRLYLVFFQEPVIGRPADLHNFHDVLHGSFFFIKLQKVRYRFLISSLFFFFRHFCYYGMMNSTVFCFLPEVL